MLLKRSIKQIVFARWATTKTKNQLCARKPIIENPTVNEFPLLNETPLDYLPCSEERDLLESAICQLEQNEEEIPIVIGDKEIRQGTVQYQVMPHNFETKIAKYHLAKPDHIKKAIKIAAKAHTSWNRMPEQERIAIWERIVCLMSSVYRQQLNAAAILSQSKTVHQAEMDTVRLIDFFRINAFHYKEGLKYQPISPTKNVKNTIRYRGLDGFVAAITPFNSTAIAANLAYTPALIGNCVLWKPSDASVLTNWLVFKICREAGLPSGVVNFLPAEGPAFCETIVASKDLAGINFTGTSNVFQGLWQQVGNNIATYKSFPRLVGELGGKNYHLVHASADVRATVAGTMRSAFEYGGQNCGACSQMYVPQCKWEAIRECLYEMRKQLSVGDPKNYENFMGAVINQSAFDRIRAYIGYAKGSHNLEIIGGGHTSPQCGYFVEPTILKSYDPQDRMLKEEICGPILTVYVYKDALIEEIFHLIDRTTTKYALSGSVYARDPDFINKCLKQLKMTAGNFYINDKSNTSVVGQQPFGGARWSGTNDKPGSPTNIFRFGNAQVVKETFTPQDDLYYPYMCE